MLTLPVDAKVNTVPLCQAVVQQAAAQDTAECQNMRPFVVIQLHRPWPRSTAGCIHNTRYNFCPFGLFLELFLEPPHLVRRIRNDLLQQCPEQPRENRVELLTRQQPEAAEGTSTPGNITDGCTYVSHQHFHLAGGL